MNNKINKFFNSEVESGVNGRSGGELGWKYKLNRWEKPVFWDNKKEWLSKVFLMVICVITKAKCPEWKITTASV